MKRLSLGPNERTFEELRSAYAEDHRHYHTSEHIDKCLCLLNENRELAECPDEVELALWFHDAIYKPVSKTNEADSADWAHRFLVANSMDLQAAGRVSELIMATVHQGQPGVPDAQLLVDIDLSILGASDAEYEQFEANVRREYKWVPGPIYRRERRKILQSFIERESIYSTPKLRNRFENNARKNLARTIQEL